MISRNYATYFRGFKTRILSEIAALIMIQYINMFIFERNSNTIKISTSTELSGTIENSNFFKNTRSRYNFLSKITRINVTVCLKSQNAQPVYTIKNIC
jgi:hypothetical protein